METHYVTTPFGGRPMTLRMLKSQHHADKIDPGLSRNKWKLFRAVCEARTALGVSERALTVLDALLTFYPGDELSAKSGLIVFPSNAQLSLRARGMTAATLRRHLAVLVDTGLVTRKDSPNGKRFARRGGKGEIDEAFGFSLSPLLARAVEIERHAAQAAADRIALRTLKERLTLCRRDIAKLLEAALRDDAGNADWEDAFSIFRALIAEVPRVPTLEKLRPVVERLALLRDAIVKRLEDKINAGKIDANESQTERHIQSSDSYSTSESEGISESAVEKISIIDHACPQTRRDLKPFPLGVVLRACPEISAYGRGGTISNWREFMTAAVVVRTMLDISPSAFEAACLVLGAENAATVIACILERGGHIGSAGGYLRDLTKRAERGEFTIGPMLMSLVRTNGGLQKLAG
jgi:replication initiation protein RepC